MSAVARALSVLAMLGVGALVALQAQVTGSMSSALGGGFDGGAFAALWSFGSGFVLISLVVFCSRSRRAALVRTFAGLRAGALSPWFFTGGFLGAVLVSAQSFAVPVIGVALLTVSFVAGQTASALLVDRFGIGPAGVQSVSPVRMLAAVITVVAVVIGVSGRLGTGGLDALGFSMVILGVVAGAGSSIQQGINGRVAGLGNAWSAGWNNFLGGTVVLVLLVGLSRIGGGGVPQFPDPVSRWWLYSAGILGMVFMTANAALVRVHGVLILSLCVIAGQVICATLLDLLSPAGYGGASTVIGAALTVVGVVIALLARNQPEAIAR